MASSVSALRVHHIEEAIRLYDTEGRNVTLAQVLAVMQSNRDENYPNLCAKCGRAGEYPLSRETGNGEDTVKVTCDQCNGIGQRVIANRAIISGYEDVPS